MRLLSVLRAFKMETQSEVMAQIGLVQVYRESKTVIVQAAVLTVETEQLLTLVESKTVIVQAEAHQEQAEQLLTVVECKTVIVQVEAHQEQAEQLLTVVESKTVTAQAGPLVVRMGQLLPLAEWHLLRLPQAIRPVHSASTPQPQLATLQSSKTKSVSLQNLSQHKPKQHQSTCLSFHSRAQVHQFLHTGQRHNVYTSI